MKFKNLQSGDGFCFKQDIEDRLTLYYIKLSDDTILDCQKMNVFGGAQVMWEMNYYNTEVVLFGRLSMYCEKVLVF